MRRQSLVAAVVFGLAGSLAAWLVDRFGQGDSGELLMLTTLAGLAACIVGGLLWYQVVLKQRAAVSVGRGALAGALIGLLSHPVYWYLGAVYSWAFVEPGAAGPFPGPISALWAACIFSLVSWLLTGWITVPLGAVVGALLAAVWPKPPFPAPTTGL